MNRETQRIMGTEIEILITKNPGFSFRKAKQSSMSVFKIFKRLEDKFSRFSQNSELSQLNKLREMAVSEEFFDVLLTALKMSKKSKGIFNPLVSLSSIGYAHDFASNNFKLLSTEYNLDFSAIEMDNRTRRVKLPQKAFLDLGGCVKGYAVDVAVKEMKKTFSDFLINAGGDLFASGTFYGAPWRIAIEDPTEASESIFGVELTNEALATSGNYRRKWKINDKYFHHLVSGRNNKNCEKKDSSVSVKASSVMLADMLATVAFVLGEANGQDFLFDYETFGYYT